MTDLEVIPDAPTQKPKRRTYNYRLIQDARDAHAATMAALVELQDRYAEVVTENAELRQQIANQRETVRGALDTAEHATYQGKRPDQVGFSQTVFAGCLLVAIGLFIGVVIGAGVR